MTQALTISKKKPPHISMDWERLRAEGITHLEQLATKIWTDFNAHDPGITILEVLCYAITDLGYRTNFDIEDIIAQPRNGKSNQKHFFSASEVLTCHPVTVNDFRRILIDMSGVKNAWLRKSEEYLYTNNTIVISISDDAIAALAQKYGVSKDKLKKLNTTSDTTFKRLQEKLAPVSIKEAGEKAELLKDHPALLDEILCKYTKYDLFFQAQRANDPKIELNGLYDIILDLDDEIETTNVLKVNQVKAAVFDKLHGWRNIAEDFANIEVVQQLPIAFCVEVSIDAEADANLIHAEILYRVENYLTPEIPFYTLDQLLDENTSCEDIYNGPVLENGFIKEEDLENSKLREIIYKSDLYNIIMSIDGVFGVNGLKLGLCENDNPNWSKDDWCFDIKAIGEEAFDKKNIPVKAILDPCCTNVYLNANGVDAPTDRAAVQESLESLQVQYAHLRGEGQEDEKVPNGTYMDLTDYTSIQEDFPETYHVGRYQLPDSAPALRQTQAKQFKGYLLFYDQILANYLAQLAHVRDLLSVTQHPNDRTLFFQALSDFDGLTELLSFEPKYVLNRTAFRKIRNLLREK